MSAPAGSIFQIGELINNTYRVESVLGRGGTSEVYKVRSETSGRVMAVKVLRAEFANNDDYLALMTREETIRDLRHDAIVQYFDTQRTNEGYVYLVMDFVDGPGLDDTIKSGGMSAEDCLVVAERICEGLHAAHSRNIIHRDLSPDNIILRGGVPSDAVIIDFGIAKDTNPGAETIIGGEFAGKYSYAAPEQLSGTADARSDIYALGALLLATFRGEPANAGNNPAQVIENKQKPLDVSGVPTPLASLISKATAPDPADRFQSVQEMLGALEGAPVQPMFAADDGEKTVIQPRQPAKPPETSPRKGRGGLWATLSLLVLAGAGAAVYFLDLIPGLKGPVYAAQDPFSLIAQGGADAPPFARGYIQSPEERGEILGLMEARGGLADLELASGNIPDSFSAEVTLAIRAAMDLPEWRVAATGNQLTVTGEAEDAPQLDALNAALSTQASNWAMQVTNNVSIAIRNLPVSDVMAVLQRLETCGPLRPKSLPAGGYAPGEEITITGAFADPVSVVTLQQALEQVAENRPVTIEPVVKNPPICAIEPILPSREEAKFFLEYSNGETGTPNLTSTFAVGQNPVMDLVIPQDVTNGYVFVTVVDVSGNAFHLLPNNLEKENNVKVLRAGLEGAATLRLAHQDTPSNSDKLAFTVDGDTPLGQSLVVIIHADEDIFDGIRPISESVESYAAALNDALPGIRSVSKSYFTTTP